MASVYTVLGPIEPSQAGICDMHEHVIFNTPGWEYSPEAFQHFDRPRVFEKIEADLRDYKSLGGATIVDTSGIGVGRDINFYADLSRETGVNIVACTGFWLEQKSLTYFATADLDWMTELFVHELTKGMGTTNIRAGIIKVAANDNPSAMKWLKFDQLPPAGEMFPFEERSFRAAARASKRTGAPITTHGVRLAERQAEIFLEEGADPSRVVIGHLEDGMSIDIERDKRLGKKGFYLGYDHIGIVPEWSPMFYAIPDARRADVVMEMIEAGFLNQIVLACDTNAWSVGLVHRGTPKLTYAHLLRSWVPLLKSRGVTDDQIHTMLVETPRKILAF